VASPFAVKVWGGRQTAQFEQTIESMLYYVVAVAA
jgi:hypothetical protein